MCDASGPTSKGIRKLIGSAEFLDKCDGEVLRNWSDWRERKKAPPLQIGRGLAALGETYFGMRTVSITWITPLEHMMSALVTVASLILTVPPSVLMASDWPFTVLAEFSFMA